MKRIAILTITDGQNYGNRLQNYALQAYLRNQGFFVETIRRRTSHDQTALKKVEIKLKNVIKKLIGRPYGKHKLLRIKKFNKFNGKYIFFSKIILHDNVYPRNINSKYDYFVVGSDQVWNAGFRIIYEDIKNHLAFFAEPQKRISYAASFGTDKIAEGYEDIFKRELPKFKVISVREESGKKIVEQCGTKAEVVLDPTMLLDSNQWIEIAKKPSYVSNNRFIVTYFLGGRDDDLNTYIKKIANGRKIFNLEIESAPEDKIDSIEVFATSPDEFVWLIANADCVLTDSFHATVFSILFHIPFCVFERKAINESYKMGSRIDTLLGLFHLERFHDNNRSFSIIPEKYESNEIEKILKIEQKKSMDFLRSALSE